MGVVRGGTVLCADAKEERVMVGRGNGKSGLALDEFMRMGNFEKSEVIDWDDVILCGKAYPIDDYILRFVYKEDSTEPTHFVITKFGMPKPLAEDAEE